VEPDDLQAQNLIAALRVAPARLREILGEFTDEAMRRPPSTVPVGVECLSAIGHACHLRDIEVDGYHVRIRRLRDEERPQLASLDGERLAVERAYESTDREAVLRQFEAARQRTLETLRTVKPEEWSRTGEFEGRTVSLRDLVGIVVEHDRGHLAALAGMPRL
jgi:hypothetical protein